MWDLVAHLAVQCFQAEIGRMAFVAGLAVGCDIGLGAYLCTKEK
jgi:hypothetical protein